MYAPVALTIWVRGAEPVDEFLGALRTAGYHDTAAEYLQRVAESPSVDEEFRQRYGYELGSTLIDAAAATPDPVLRDRLWDQGLAKLKAFVEANSEHQLAIAANWKVAETLVVRGRALAARAARSRDSDKLREQARAMFAEAVQVYEAIEKQHLAEFEKQAEGADREKRNQLGAPILEARLRIGSTLTEVAGTHEAGSESANGALQQAIDRFKQLYDKYSDEGFLAAYIARVREAENYFQMGKSHEALSRLKDLLELDIGNQDLRDRVLTPAYLLALRVWHKLGDFKSAVDKTERYAGNPRAQEVDRPDWLQMQYLLALAYQQQAEQAKPGDANRSKLETEARKLAAEVIKHRGDVQDEARQLLGKLGRPVEEADSEAKTFAEALEKATAAVQDYATAKMALESAADNSSTAERKKAAADTRAAAQRSAQRAISLADDETDVDQLNTARFYLAYLHWENGQADSAENKSSSHYFDAAVLSEFIARRFPEHANARQSMSIALASYQRIRQDAAQEAQEAAEKAGQSAGDARAAGEAAGAGWSDKVTELAQYAVDKWQDTDEAASAVAVLASLAVERNEFDAAIQLIEKLKAGSARRAETELRIGRAMWSSYTSAKKDLEARAKERAEATDQQSASQAIQIDATGTVPGNARGAETGIAMTEQALGELARKAQALLEAGLATAKSGEVDRNFVLGLWALVQSYVGTSQADKAIPLLEDEKFGLLTLVNNKHEATEIEGLMFDAYRLALRAYIAVKPQQLEKAISTMDALEKITGNDAKGRELLTAIYIAMGRDLQQEIESLSAAGNTGEVASLSAAFEAFLNRLVSRQSGNNFNSLFWIGDTYAQLGAGLAESAKSSSAERERAKSYFKQAVTAFEKILESEKSSSGFMPDKYRPVVEMRLAKALRGAGEHNQALKSLVAILKEKPNVLDAQFEAAYTYQDYADSDRALRGKYFLHAIRGGQNEDYRNVWGWNSLAERIRTQEHRLRGEPGDAAKTEQAEQYRQLYHEARYNSIYCTVALAQFQSEAKEKERLLKLAKQGIWSVYTVVDPQFGGGEWKGKNDRLLKEIQSALGEPAIGLRELETRKQQESAVSSAAK
jgi:hypothetical protein